jgi:O-acetyl-ADP-ribose deacetylase (regulator of RNase III)
VAAVIKLGLGDITSDRDADVIVNAANRTLMGGGGVDGAIHRAAGPGILAECRRHGGCEVGEVKLTGAGALPARFIAHAVGPVWHGGGQGEARLLAACFTRAIELAAANGCERIAFPAISTGAFGYPLPQAARVALEATRDALDQHPEVREARFWLFDRESFEVFSEQLDQISRGAHRDRRTTDGGRRAHREDGGSDG